MKRSKIFAKDRSSRVSRRIHKAIEMSTVCPIRKPGRHINKIPRLASNEQQSKINSLVCELSQN